MSERYCPYCTRFKPDVGFKQILHPPTRSNRGQCPQCQDLRKKPHKELVAMAERDRIERNKRS